MMEPQQPQGSQPNEEGGSGKGGFLSRQSSTRWTPTTDQIRILKDLYYNNGIRSPSAEQIQRISARLRQYGKIEGKNVFYWFQNHKARERQKKRFTSDNVPMQRPPAPTNAAPWKPDHDPPIHTHYSNISSTGISSASSSSVEMITVAQMGNYGYGSVPMEKSFRVSYKTLDFTYYPHELSVFFTLLPLFIIAHDALKWKVPLKEEPTPLISSIF